MSLHGNIRKLLSTLAISLILPAAAGADDVPLVGPQSLTALADAVKRYRSIAETGEWKPLPAGPALRMNAKGRRVVLLRKRLRRTEDLSGKQHPSGQRYDRRLKKAVIRFQRRHGLAPSGVVYHDTWAALNVPASIRLGQLRENYSQLLHLVEHNISAANVVVNVPGFALEAVAQGRVALRSRVIVGHPQTPTPPLNSAITSVTLSPDWRVPPRLAARDILPLLRWNRDAFHRLGLRAFSVSGTERTEIDPETVNWFTADRSTFTFRQRSGPRNVMGLIRINMPNDRVILLHDTPNKELFRHIAPAFSAGCIRVKRVFDLAVWLLRNRPGWGRKNIEDAIAAGNKKTIPLRKTVPVRLIYLTAWNKDGTVHFRPDIYGRYAINDSRREAGRPNRVALAKPAIPSTKRP